MTPTDGAEGLLGHDAHGVIDAGQHLRRHVRRSRRVLAGSASDRAAPCAPAATASAIWPRTNSAAAGATSGPSVVAGSSRIVEL